jgi:hypothetical protein
MKRKRKITPLGDNTILVTPQLSTKSGELATLKNLDILAFNEEAELAFVKLITEFCHERGGAGVKLREVYAETAYELGVSTETAKRYLLKHTARRAEFVVVGSTVLLRGTVGAPIGSDKK